MDLVESAIRWWERAVAMPAVSFTGLAARFPGLVRGWPLGEGGGLAFGLASGLVAFATCLVEFALEALVVALEALVVLAQLFDQGAELLQLFQDGEGHGYRLADLERCHRGLDATDSRHRLLWEPTTVAARAAKQGQSELPESSLETGSLSAPTQPPPWEPKPATPRPP